MAQLVEYDLAKVGVAGSSPVSRFFYLPEIFLLIEDSGLFYFKDRLYGRNMEIRYT